MSESQSKYTEDNAKAVLEHLWEGGTVGVIATKLGVRRMTIYDWAEAHPDFGKQFAAAMIGGAHSLVEEIIPIIDNTDEDAQSRKVRAWGRLEIAKRKAPHLYGDKIDLNHGGTVATVTRVELVALTSHDDGADSAS